MSTSSRTILPACDVPASSAHFQNRELEVVEWGERAADFARARVLHEGRELEWIESHGERAPLCAALAAADEFGAVAFESLADGGRVLLDPIAPPFVPLAEWWASLPSDEHAFERARAVLALGCAALARLHEAGFVHGAIAPRAVAVDPSTDALRIARPARPIRLGAVPVSARGVLGYFCPEFGAPDAKAEPSWDVFAWSAVALCAMSARPALEWLSEPDRPLPNLRVFHRDLPPGWGGWLARTLSRDASARFGSAQEAADRLAQLSARGAQPVQASLSASALDPGVAKQREGSPNQDRCILVLGGSVPDELALDREAFATGDLPAGADLLAGVTDGVSLAMAGELAARSTAAAVVEFARDPVKLAAAQSSMAVAELFDEANRELGRSIAAMLQPSDASASIAPARAPAATLALVHVGPERAVAACVGDSRVYLLRDGVLDQLTVDGDRLTVYLRRGLSASRAREEGNERELMSWVGMFEADPRGAAWLRPDRPLQLSRHELFGPYTFAPRAGDVLCCCSDGVSDYVDSGGLDLAALLDNPSPAAACRRIVATVNDRGGHDNISLVVSRLLAEAPGREGSHR